jgi:hypothetical protein
MRSRRALVVGPPVLFGLVTVLHPLPNWGRIVDSLAPRLGLWIGVHVAQLVLIPLVMLTVWTLLAGLDGRPPMVAGAALVVCVAFYSAFDAVVGLGIGLLVRRVSALDGAERDAAAHLAQWFWGCASRSGAARVLGHRRRDQRVARGAGGNSAGAPPRRRFTTRRGAPRGVWRRAGHRPSVPHRHHRHGVPARRRHAREAREARRRLTLTAERHVACSVAFR